MPSVAPSRSAAWLADHSDLVLALAVVATGALALPFVAMRPEGGASQEPEAELFRARNRATERFATDVHRIVFVVEVRGNNLLLKAPLLELHKGFQALRRNPELGPKLFSYRDPQTKKPVRGGVTVAAAVNGKPALVCAFPEPDPRRTSSAPGRPSGCSSTA